MRRCPALAVVHLVAIVRSPMLCPSSCANDRPPHPWGVRLKAPGRQGHPADVGGFGDDQMHEVRPDPVAQVVHLVEVIVGESARRRMSTRPSPSRRTVQHLEPGQVPQPRRHGAGQRVRAQGGSGRPGRSRRGPAAGAAPDSPAKREPDRSGHCGEGQRPEVRQVSECGRNRAGEVVAPEVEPAETGQAAQRRRQRGRPGRCSRDPVP